MERCSFAEVEEWFLSLCADDPETANRVTEAVDHLGEEGPGLGRPLVDRIQRSKPHNLKELRPGSSGRSEVRMLFIFDPERQASILAAGDKSGAWNSWYHRNTPIVEQRYRQYLTTRKEADS